MKDFRQFGRRGRGPASRERLSLFGFGWGCASDLDARENFPAPSRLGRVLTINTQSTRGTQAVGQAVWPLRKKEDV